MGAGMLLAFLCGLDGVSRCAQEAVGCADRPPRSEHQVVHCSVRDCGVGGLTVLIPAESRDGPSGRWSQSIGPAIPGSFAATATSLHGPTHL